MESGEEYDIEFHTNRQASDRAIGGFDPRPFPARFETGWRHGRSGDDTSEKHYELHERLPGGNQYRAESSGILEDQSPGFIPGDRLDFALIQLGDAAFNFSLPGGFGVGIVFFE